MLQSYIQWNEERLAKQDDIHKLISPFEWGIDLLLEEQPEHSPFETLINYGQNCIIESEHYFEPEPVRDYSFSNEFLSFPSTIETETPENNTVHCRVFEHSARDKAIVLLPHWNASVASYDRFAKILKWAGITAVRMSLPYHDKRRPSSMKVAQYMVSSNIGRTIRSSRQAVLDTRSVISWLDQRGYKKIGVVGSSIGSSIALIAAAHDPRVKAAAFLLLASDFGEVIWTGRATKHIRKVLEGELDLAQVNKLWSVISPITYVPRLCDRKVPVFVISARDDNVFKPYLTQRIIDKFKDEGVDCSWKIFPCGHYTLGTVPYNALALSSVIRFLKANL